MQRTLDPNGSCTQQLGTWDLGNSKCSTGFGQVYDHWVLVTLRERDSIHHSPFKMEEVLNPDYLRLSLP